jgi:hypothetical protein
VILSTRKAQLAAKTSRECERENLVRDLNELNKHGRKIAELSTSDGKEGSARCHCYMPVRQVCIYTRTYEVASGLLKVRYLLKV